MLQLLSHLLIGIFFYRQLKILLQEWGAWHIVFIFATLYSLWAITLYGVYFFMYLQTWEVPALQRISCIIGTIFLFHVLMLMILRIVTDDTTTS